MESIAVIPSAPASRASRAIPTESTQLGLIFIRTGLSVNTFAFFSIGKIVFLSYETSSIISAPALSTLPTQLSTSRGV